MKNFVRAALVSVLTVASVASADIDVDININHHHGGSLTDGGDQHRHVLLSVHGVLPYGHFRGFPLGVGASLYIPIVSNGFIPPVNDEFGLDFGADAIFFLGRGNGFALWIPVSVLWTFHFSHSFAAYVKAGVALRIFPGDPLPLYPDFVGAIGLNWMFARSVGLRVEAGYPGIKLGILFAL